MQGIRDEPARMRVARLQRDAAPDSRLRGRRLIAAVAGVLSSGTNAPHRAVSIAPECDHRRPRHRGDRRPRTASRARGSERSSSCSSTTFARWTSASSGPERFHTLIGIVFLVIVLVSPRRPDRDLGAGRRERSGDITQGRGLGRATPSVDAVSVPAKQPVRLGARRVSREPGNMQSRLRDEGCGSRYDNKRQWLVAGIPAQSGPHSRRRRRGDDARRQPAGAQRHRGRFGGAAARSRSHPLGLRGSLRCVLRTRHRRCVSAAVTVRRRQGQEPEEAARRLHGRRDRRPTRHRDRRLRLRRRHADKAIEETRRLMEQEGADILIGPLSGDEGIAVANYAKEHPDQTFVERHLRRAGHHAQGAGAELLPLHTRRRAVVGRSGRLRVQRARLEEGRGRRRRLLVRLHVAGRLRGRVLRGRR